MTVSAEQSTPTPSTELLVSGMTCNNCARHVTEAIQGVSGVRSAMVTLDSGRASVRWIAGSPGNVPAVLDAVKAAGYEARPLEARTHDHHHDHPGAKRSGWHLNLWIGVIGTVPLMIGEWIFGLGMARWFQWLSLALAGVVQFFAGAQFYRGAWAQLKVGRSNMDTLVALGSTVAFGYSVWALFSGHGGHVYFMEAAAIITLISLGHWFEARVSSRAASALKSLLHLAPQTARRLNQSGSSRRKEAQIEIRSPKSEVRNHQSLLTSAATDEIEVSVAELKGGDLVALRPGDRVPTDGETVSGDSAVDESMLTGESVPVDKSVGAKLYAGTVNLNGRLVMRVTATGEATALANIIAAVQRAQTSRANIQRIGDQVASVFVPVVVLVAVVAGLWWGLMPESARQAHEWLAQFLWPAHPPVGTAAAFVIAAAVLIIACPCAMGLATPAAIMASANSAAKRGILIRDGVALEKAGTITAIIFDKTGTLTAGKPEVVKSWRETLRRFPGFEGSDEALPSIESLAAALARHSTHPISRAVVAFVAVPPSWDESAAERTEENGRFLTNTTTVEDWEEIRGSGVEGNVQHSTLNSQLSTTPARLGSLAWLRECGVDLKAGESFIAEWSAQGATIVGLAAEKSLLGLFAVKDTLKPGAAKVVERLQEQGLKSYLLTGDNKLTATSIARQVGIAAENVFAEVRPEQKAEFVKRLQQEGQRVAFVGDGINDAPALEQADLGIAVSRASDVAREAADIILLKSEIEAVPEALGLARATLRTIKQNLFWAFFYNAAGVPLAALGFMSPILCAAAMGLSDFIVIGNALRLRRRKM
jgi:Cu+-exporting ATPase